MNIYTIYKATCLINDKVYIGYDSNWPKRRYEHKQNMKFSNQIFYRALRKYGWDSFTWTILYQSLDPRHTLKEMETFFIKEYNSCIHFTNSNGYNMTEGGEGTIGYKHTNSTKKLIAESARRQKGKPKPPRLLEHRLAMSRAKQGSIPWNKGKKTGQIPWNKGKTGIYTELQLTKMKESALLRIPHNCQWWNDGVQDYFVPAGNAHPSWVKGRYLRKRIMKEKTCPHCGQQGSGGNMSRYHFDNCKFKS